VLVYRATCRQCRVISAIATGVGCGFIRRIALDSAEAEALGAVTGVPRGKLRLHVSSQVFTGVSILPAVCLAPLIVLWMAVGFEVRGKPW
jgi:hypothetical protein